MANIRAGSDLAQNVTYFTIEGANFRDNPRTHKGQWSTKGVHDYSDLVTLGGFLGVDGALLAHGGEDNDVSSFVSNSLTVSIVLNTY